MSRKSQIQILDIYVYPESTPNYKKFTHKFKLYNTQPYSVVSSKIWLLKFGEIWSLKLCSFEKMYFEVQKAISISMSHNFKIRKSYENKLELDENKVILAYKSLSIVCQTATYDSFMQ